MYCLQFVHYYWTAHIYAMVVVDCHDFVTMASAVEYDIEIYISHNQNLTRFVPGVDILMAGHINQDLTEDGKPRCFGT